MLMTNICQCTLLTKRQNKANLVLLFELTYFVSSFNQFKPCLAEFGMWIPCYYSYTMALSLKTHYGTWSWFVAWHLRCSCFHLLSPHFGKPHTFFQTDTEIFWYLFDFWNKVLLTAKETQQTPFHPEWFFVFCIFLIQTSFTLKT